MVRFYVDMGMWDPEDIDEVEIAARHDITLKFTEGEPCYVNAYRKTIYLNQYDSREWQRYIFFHEFAHAHLHGDLNAFFHDKLWVDYCERDAERFALHACLPRHMLGLYDLEDDAIILQLARDFRLPLGVVEERLRQITRKGVR